MRLDYDHLDRIFAGTERAPDPVAAAIATARQATAAIARAGRGAGLEVSSSEPEFTFTADGDVEAAHALVQTEAHRLIEKLMILTNEQVARLLERKHVPALYRVHEQPDPARVRVLIDQLASLGVPTPALAKAAGPAEAGRCRDRGEPPGRRGGEAAGTRREQPLLARAPGAETGPLQRGQPRPCRPRQQRLLALHLADPPLSRPDRPPRAARDRRRQRGASRHPRGRSRRHPLLRPRARVDADRTRRRRHLRRLPAAAGAVRARRRDGLRGRGLRGHPRWCFHPFPWRACRRLRGVLPGPADAGRALRDQRGRVRVDRHADRPAGSGSATRSRSGSSRSRRRAGAST